jgi:[CysO sulfur-carrier protein]-S-L-cysteine hydrolase
VLIARSAYDAIVAHARESFPNECCGLLVGSAEQVGLAVRARNLEESPTRFQVDPLDHFTAIRIARMQGQSVVGVYHSHMARDAQPSPSDLREASYREYVYVIVSLAGDPPEVRAYRLRDDTLVDVEMSVSA